MKHSSKIELISKLNNTTTNLFYITNSNDVENLLEILYLEGQILSYKKVNDKYKVVVNSFLNDNKLKMYRNQHGRSFKYRDVIKIKSLLRTVYFHTTDGLLSLETLKSKKLGGFPILKI